MSKVITFSTKFPSYHPRKGEPTFFVEMLWKFIWDNEKSTMNPLRYYQPHYDDIFHKNGEGITNIHQYKPKLHTIRKGRRFKVGDKFSPRVWGYDINPKSGRSGPYHSKQITIAEDIEVKAVYDISIDLISDRWYLNGREIPLCTLRKIAENDGLSFTDFAAWFNKPFTGQIICWADVKY